MALPNGPLSAYLGVRNANLDANQRTTALDAQTARQAQGMLEKLQEQKQLAELKGVMASTGGDISKAMPLLIQSGNFKGAGLLAQIQAQQEKAKPEPYTLTPGSSRFGPDNKPLASVPAATPNAGGFSLSPGQQRFDAMGKPVASVPESPTGGGSQPEIIRLQAAIAATADPAVKSQLLARIRQITTHQPAVNVYSQSLTPGVNAQGQPVFAQASGRPDVAPRVVEGIFPPERAATTKTAAEQQAATATAGSVEERIARMSQLIQGGAMAGSVVGPLGIASRLGETAAGAVNPAQPTPAIDYQNEMRLLLSDVRKLVEKDPNLSKDEREAMYETIGGGTFQTPGSALRTLQNVLEHVKSKSPRGNRPSASPLVDAVGRAGWAYEPDKYDYRVMDGKVQRKAK